MKASIIISLYNKERYVAQAIESALAQNYDDLEVIVVNDGSTDGSRDVAVRYANRVTLIDQLNAGVACARNAGFLASTGEAVLFLDADDWLEPSFLTRTVPALADPAVGLVATDVRNCGDNESYVVTPAITLYGEARGNQICSTGALIRRTTFRQTNGFTVAFQYVGGGQTFVGFEDWSMWLDILKRDWQAAVVHEPLFHFRVGSGGWNCSGDAYTERWDACLQIVRGLHPEVYGT